MNPDLFALFFVLRAPLRSSGGVDYFNFERLKNAGTAPQSSVSSVTLSSFFSFSSFSLSLFYLFTYGYKAVKRE